MASADLQTTENMSMAKKQDLKITKVQNHVCATGLTNDRTTILSIIEAKKYLSVLSKVNAKPK